MDALRQNKWFMFTLELIKSLIVICNYCKCIENGRLVSCIQNRWNIAIWLVFIGHSHRLVICCVKCVFLKIFAKIIPFYLAYLIEGTCFFFLFLKKVQLSVTNLSLLHFSKYNIHYKNMGWNGDLSDRDFSCTVQWC